MNGTPCAIGSLPHIDPVQAVNFILTHFEGIPFWPQLPKKSYLESFYVQYAEGMPSCVIDEKKGLIHFETESRMDELAPFYEKIMAKQWDAFAISEQSAAGLYEFLKQLQPGQVRQIKGHVTGPLSFALSVCDHNDRFLAYDENYFDAVVQGCLAKGFWQVKLIAPLAEQVIIFFDEPSLVGFGSAFVQIERRQVVETLKLVVDNMHQVGAKVGIHCCANTDWSLIFDSGADILSFDAFSFFESLLIYDGPLKAFYEKGGELAIGIVPTDDQVFSLSHEDLLTKLIHCVDEICALGIEKEKVITQSLITPACGLGTTDVKLAERALNLTVETSKAFASYYGK